MSDPWEKPVRLHELARGPVSRRLEPDADARAALAKALKLEGLPVLQAEVTVRPWMDGAELLGRIHAVVVQTCGVTLELFEQPVECRFEVRVVSADSPHAPVAEGGEIEVDLEAPDPPDVLAGDTIDIAHYVVEHLALELDPFPRRPGATFDYEPPEADASPFAALKTLMEPKA